MLRQGEHLLAGEDVYGGAHYLFAGGNSSRQVEVSYVNTCDFSSVEQAINKRTKLLWLESPSNPLLRLADIVALTRLAKKHKVITVVDNTFATPCFQKPLDLGADIVLHSSSKYLSGDSDIIGGAIITNRSDLFKDLAFQRHVSGNIPEPYDCFRIMKGIKTLTVRMQKHEENAKKVANFLAEQPEVKIVHYPGLPGHPQHELAKQQMSGFGTVVSFELKSGTEAATALIREMRQDLRTTIAHAKISQQIQLEENASESVLRLSIGLDNVDGLINNLGTALQRVSQDW